MFIRRFRRLFFVGLAALLALTSIAPALAATPMHVTDEFSGSFTTHCNGFDINENVTVTSSLTVFFNEAGNLERIVGHDTVSDTLTNSATGTSVVPKRSPQNYTIYFHDGTFDHAMYRGIFLLLTVPGKGNIVHDVGRVVIHTDLSMTFQGRHEFEGEDAVLCTALAGV